MRLFQRRPRHNMTDIDDFPLLKKVIDFPTVVSPEPMDLIRLVCALTGASLTRLYSKSRKGELIVTRQACCFFLYHCNKMVLVDIAYLLRPRSPLHHTTILYHRDEFQRRALSGKEPHITSLYMSILELYPSTSPLKSTTNDSDQSQTKLSETT